MSHIEKKVLINKSHVHETHLDTPQTQDFQPPKAVAERYEYIRNIGKGSQGQVWLAKRRSDNTLVAVKQLSIQSLKSWKQYELFNREAKILSTLNIEGVVPFCEYIESLDDEQACVCIVQKYIAGKTLASMLKAKHRFKTETIYDIIAQVIKILEKLHSHQPPVIHRDIKPSNLMLTPKGNGFYQVTLIDFGAVANPQLQTGGSTVTGTYGYMPPEQLMGQAQPASDIYALGAVAVELLSGCSPSEIEVCDFKLVIEPLLVNLPPEVVHTLNLMLEPAIENRICNYQALFEQFDAYSHQRQTPFLNILRRTTVPKLEDVESIGQLGNYQIWQNLDPQQIINFENCPQHLQVIKSFRGFEKFTNIAHISIWIILTLCLSILFVHLTPFFHIIFNLILLIFCAASLAIGFQLSQELVQNRLYLSSTLEKVPHPNISPQDYQKIQYILGNGEKVVGKILSIEYIGVDEQYSVTQHTLDFKPHILTSDFPKFKILYKFQYFSDQTTGVIDFYGDFITYTQPEGHYAVGDPITLIANFDNYTKSSFKLSILPYPYPFGDMMQLNDVLYTCDVETQYLHTGEIKYGKQFALYCLAHFDTCNDMTILKAAEMTTSHTDDSIIATQLYQKLAKRYLDQFQTDENEDDKVYYNELDAYIGMNVNLNHFNIFYNQLGKQFLLRNDIGDNDNMIKMVEFYINKLHNKNDINTFYEQLAQQLLIKFDLNGNIKLLAKTADIYKNKLENTQKSKAIFKLLAQHYMTMFESSSNLDALIKTAEIFRWELNDKETAANCYYRLIQNYMTKFNASKDENLIFKAIDISQWELNDAASTTTCYHRLADHYLTCYEKNHNETNLHKAIDIYQNQLQHSYSLHANKAFTYLAELYVQKYNNDNDLNWLAQAAETYLSINDHENHKKYYRKMVNEYISMFNATKDDTILIKAADICSWNLNDQNVAKSCYECLGQYYLSQFDNGDDAAIVKAAEIYHERLCNKDTLQTCFEKLKNRCLKKFQDGNQEDSLIAAKEYCARISEMIETYTTLNP